MKNGAIDLGLLERATARLGDAVVDPAIWPELLVDICAGTGADGGLLLQADVRTFDVPRTPSIDEGVKFYFRNNWHVNETRAKKGIPLLLAGRPVVLDQDLMTPEEISRDPFYNECLIPNHMPWFAGIGFRAGPALWTLALQRDERSGPYDPVDKRILATLAPCLGEVATLSAALGRTALNGATCALNVLARPALAIDRHGAVLDVNAAADGLFDDELAVRCGRLSIRDPDARAAFDRFLASMAATLDTAALPADPVIVRRQAKPPVVIGVLPVPAAARTPFLGARALLTLTEVAPSRPPGATLLMQIFGMTRSEARIAAAIAEGSSLEEAAGRLGIARETARTHLKSVFGKTDTHRQAELAARLATMSRLLPP